MRWLRDNISFVNALLLIVGLIVAIGRNYGVNETKVGNIENSQVKITETLSKVEGKVDTTIKQNADTGLAIGLMQRDVKDVSNDVTEMKEVQQRQGDAILDLQTRVGVIENRQNKR